MKYFIYYFKIINDANRVPNVSSNVISIRIFTNNKYKIRTYCGSDYLLQNVNDFWNLFSMSFFLAMHLSFPHSSSVGFVY